MTYALTLIRGKSEKRESTLSLFRNLKEDRRFEEKYGVEIEKVLISFGWPDFILLLKSENVELVKHAIVVLREKAAEKGDDIETSSIICVTQNEIDKKREKWRGLRER